MPAWLRDSKMLSESRREEIFGAVGKWLEAWSVGHATSVECDRWGMTEALRVAAQRALSGLGQAPDALLIDGPVNLLRRPRRSTVADALSVSEPGDLLPPPEPEPSDAQRPDSRSPDSVPFDAAQLDSSPSDSGPHDPMWSDPVWSDAMLSDPVWSDVSECDVIPSVSQPFGGESFAGVIRPIVDGDAKCASVAAASVLAKVVRDRIMREEADHFPVYGFERNKGYPSLMHQTALRGYGPSAIHRRSWAFMEDLPWRGHPCPVRMQISCVDERQGRLFPASWPSSGHESG
jgi:ribonuclease HII